MSDSYQAIYDATRSRINPTPASSVYDAARDQFDISWQKKILQQEIAAVSMSMQRPSVLYRPQIFPEGNQWCALYGTNIQEGVAGFGDSPADAMDAFDVAWFQKLVRGPRP